MMSSVTLVPAWATSGLVKNVCDVSTLPCPPGPGTVKDTGVACRLLGGRERAMLRRLVLVRRRCPDHGAVDHRVRGIEHPLEPGVPRVVAGGGHDDPASVLATVDGTMRRVF